MDFFQTSPGLVRHRQEPGTGFRGAAQTFKSDQRGSIVVVTALVIPVLVMSAGMAVEISHWTVVELELQRTADIAALAGATEYAIASNAFNAANAAASVAELNGVLGSTTRIWNSSTKLLTDDQISVQVTAGVRQRQNTALKVTVGRIVPLLLTRIMSSSHSVTIRATGWAEFKPNMQPCIVALSTSGTGVTVPVQDSSVVRLTECSIRSNASIATGGSAKMLAPGFYANGIIKGNVSGGPLYSNAGTIPDPYASHPAVQAALGKLVLGPKREVDDSNQTLSPGTWSKWDIKGVVTLKPGIYYVNGDIFLDTQGSLSGTGVTIVTSGTLNMNDRSGMTLSAALTPHNPGDAVLGGAIPGVVFAGNSASSSSFHGSKTLALTGVVYYPNGTLHFGGTDQGGGSGCLEVIAASVAIKGSSALAPKCASYGALSFSSGGPAAVALVQ